LLPFESSGFHPRFPKVPHQRGGFRKPPRWSVLAERGSVPALGSTSLPTGWRYTIVCRANAAVCRANAASGHSVLWVTAHLCSELCFVLNDLSESLPPGTMKGTPVEFPPRLGVRSCARLRHHSDEVFAGRQTSDPCRHAERRLNRAGRGPSSQGARRPHLQPPTFAGTGF
jgi:hypothetical protein